MSHFVGVGIFWIDLNWTDLGRWRLTLKGLCTISAIFEGLFTFCTVVLTRFGSFHLMYLLTINQALPYGCIFVTYGQPGGFAAGDITIIWNDVLN